MTIRDIANEQKISRQSLYQRIKRAGLNVDTLTDQDTGELTTEGVNAIRALFISSPSRSAKVDNDTANAVNDVSRLKEIIKQKDALISDLEERLRMAQAAAARVPDLEHLRDYLEQKLTEALLAQAETVKRLPMPVASVEDVGQDQEQTGLFAKLKKGKKDKKKHKKG